MFQSLNAEERRSLVKEVLNRHWAQAVRLSTQHIQEGEASHGA